MMLVWIVLAAAVGVQGPEISETIVNAPPSEVWKVFATRDGYKKLGVAHCEMDFRVGGLIRSHYDSKGVLGDEGTIENEILAFEPERMVAIRIHKPPKGFPFSEATWKGTWTVITLSDLGDGRTHLRIAGMGYTEADESQKMRKFFEAGNASVLRFLKRKYDPTEPAPASRPHVDSPLAPIVHERVVEMARADAWKLYSTNEGWKRFFGVETRIELKPGGKFEILFGSDAPAGQRGSEGCTVLSFVPEQMLSYTWNAPPKLAHARTKHTWVVVHFDEIATTRTRIRVDHLGFSEQAAENPEHRAEWETARSYFDQAWPKVLDALKAQETKR